MDRYAYGGHPIFIADRGFSSYNVFAHAIENQIDFMIRAKDLNVQRLLGVNSLLDKLDTTVELFLPEHNPKRSINILKKGNSTAIFAKISHLTILIQMTFTMSIYSN